MKKIFSILITTSICATAFAQKSMEIGTKMPTDGYKITDVLTNTATSLADVKTDKGLLVVFTCNTCPFVIRNISRTKEVLTYAKEHGVGVLMVNSNEAQRKDADEPKAMVKFAKEHNYPDYVIDTKSQLADIFGASHTPEVYLFNSDQTLVYKGAMDDNPANPSEAKEMYLENAMSNLLADKEIMPNETKSVGCSIKRLP